MTAPVAPPASHPAKSRYDIALDCVHCGLCLPVCPTYLHLGDEADSPRGRIYLMRAHDEGRQAITTGLVEHLDRCLVCRACETACPSGVQFGAMMEDFRALVQPQVEALAVQAGANTMARMRSRLGRFMLLNVLPHRRRLGMAMGLLRLYQTMGVASLLRRSGLLATLGLATQEALMPDVPDRAARRPWPGVLPAHGRRRARVLFLRGCVTPELLPTMQHASIAALRHNGCEVVTPPAQVCCGALHFHTGFQARGVELLAANVAAFEGNDFDAVVVNAAGCGSTLKEYGTLAAGHPTLAAAASAFGARVRDIHEFLDTLGLVPPPFAVRARVAYDEPCHLLHGQRVSAAPRAILGAIPGVEMVPLRDSDRCCGSAGVYNIMQPQLSEAILAEKVRHVAASGCDVVATGNPGCILQIRTGLRRAAAADSRLASVRVMHPMELLAAGYAQSEAVGRRSPA